MGEIPSTGGNVDDKPVVLNKSHLVLTQRIEGYWRRSVRKVPTKTEAAHLYRRGPVRNKTPPFIRGSNIARRITGERKMTTRIQYSSLTRELKIDLYGLTLGIPGLALLSRFYFCNPCSPSPMTAEAPQPVPVRFFWFDSLFSERADFN